MTRRHVLHLDATQLVAYRWRAGNVTESARFAANADGHAAFAEFLRQRPDGLYLMLCDLADESFVSEMVPFVRGPDRSALIRRKLSQLFFGTPLACARSLGRGRTGRRDEQILFCSLTRPATLEPWLAALRSAEVALSGIHSVALASEPVLECMRLTEGQTLLLHVSAAGVRQSFFENGRLRFSRLTPLTALSSNDLPRACAEEARRLHPYLLSQRLITRKHAAQRPCPGAAGAHGRIRARVPRNRRAAVRSHRQPAGGEKARTAPGAGRPLLRNAVRAGPDAPPPALNSSRPPPSAASSASGRHASPCAPPAAWRLRPAC
jgi:hypothetical protein